MFRVFYFADARRKVPQEHLQRIVFADSATLEKRRAALAKARRALAKKRAAAKKAG